MLQTTFSIAAILVSALIFGGMARFAFGFAAFLFSAIPVAEARLLIRKHFPHFYVFVIACAALAAIASTTVPARQVLMPAINVATDAGACRTFGRLHGLSVVFTLIHIAAAGAVLARFVL